MIIRVPAMSRILHHIQLFILKTYNWSIIGRMWNRMCDIAGTLMIMVMMVLGFLTYTTNQINQCNFSSWFGRSALTVLGRQIQLDTAAEASKKVLHHSFLIHFHSIIFDTLEKNIVLEGMVLCSPPKEEDVSLRWKFFAVLALDCQFCLEKKRKVVTKKV